LNDFLPEGKRGQINEYEFSGNPSVKDAIEAIGVPHCEIDMIYANGSSVEFSYTLKNTDFVEVYPAGSEKEGIHLISKIESYRFVLDVHLGKLAKYIRMLGFDTIYENNFTDEFIIDKSIAENRIILTRDIGILKNGKTKHGYWLRSQEPRQQIGEIIKKYNLFSYIKPFTRCIKCNGLLVSIKKNEIADQLEPLTSKYYNEFYECENCKSIFWKGSHYERMQNFIENLLSKNF
jgi:uncharacterized protein with PIN domain